MVNGTGGNNADGSMFFDREFYQSTIVVLSSSRLVPRSSRFVINDFSYEDLLWLKEHISEPWY